MVAIFIEEVMAEQAEIVRKRVRNVRRRKVEQGACIFLGWSAIYKMVVGEGLFGALRLTLRAVLKRVVSQARHEP